MIKKLKAPDSEADIYKKWKYTDKVYISCVCIAYNHEKYIRDALDSILAQQTEYRFELIIHDDKSTDATREIILEYKNKFPSIITLILQDENQYSKCKRIIPITIPYIKGEYTTLCEGDDFWDNELKLQKQINSLNEHHQINICFTTAKSLSNDCSVKPISYHQSKKSIFTTTQVIQGGGEFMPTASLMIRSSILKNLPTWYYIAPVGDYFLQIFASMYNGAIYLPISTCVYRKETNSSWSSQRKYLTINQIKYESTLYEEAFDQLSNEDIPKEIIQKEISNQLMNLSILAIKNNFYLTAKELICKSWLRNSHSNKKQTIIYRMRNHLYILKLIFLITKK